MSEQHTGIYIHVEMILMLLSGLGVIATAGVLMLKSIFITKKGCKESQEACQPRVCGEIDSIKKKIDDMEVKRDEAIKIIQKKDIWLAESMILIGAKVGAKIEHMPK